MKTILLIAAIAVIGCSKKSDSIASGDEGCATAIGKAVDAMMNGRRKAMADQRAKSGQPPQEADTARMAEISTKLRGALVTRCTEDLWPPGVVKCFAGASDMASIKQCEKDLTPDQNRKRQQEVMKVMMGGRMMGSGGMGGMPHGGMGGPGGTGGPPHGGMGPPGGMGSSSHGGMATPIPATGAPPAVGSGSAGPIR